MRDPLLFGDYRNTLEDSEARLYEDIQDFEAAKALFQEVCVFCVIDNNIYHWMCNFNKQLSKCRPYCA